MIIKSTFNDNDYTSILENFWTKFKFKNMYCCLNDIKDSDKYEDLLAYRDKHTKMEELLKKAIFEEDSMKISECQEFEQLIRESLLAYVKMNVPESYEYLSKNLYVNIRLSIRDKCENDEVVYYFVGHDKYITM